MPISRIAFSSCMNAERCPEQPVWDAIAAQKPDLLLLLGDLIYMDWGLASLARVPAAKQAWEDHKDKAEQAFAEEMHWRYALQWAVPGFAKLVSSMRTRQGVLLAWDDHDFAWNNALGIDGKEAVHGADARHLNDKVVPPDLKRIAWALRRQFEMVLRENKPGDDYPPLPALNDASPDAPKAQEAHFGDIRVMLLDQRWSRTHRDAEGAALLSEDDRKSLYDALDQHDKGLLILAGSSPLKHRSLSGSHSSWWAGPDKKMPDRPDRAYPEYRHIKEVQRPVLYLAGEIHRNAWGGPVEGGGSVVQVLSSGAGLGRLLLHRYPGGFGSVTIDGTARDAVVTVELFTDGGTTREDEQHLTIVGGALHKPVAEGECSADALLSDPAGYLAHLLVDKHSLPVLAARSLGSAFAGQPSPVVALENIDEQALIDDVPTTDGQAAASNKGIFAADWPTALRVSGEAGGVRLDTLRTGNPSVQARDVMDEAFLRAWNQPKPPSVVLFIHGFGKGAAAAITQAAALRERFGCEVILYTWPTGSGDGLFGALAGLAAAQNAASWTRKSLAATWTTFGRVARVYRSRVKAVVVARSLGAQALAEVDEPLGVESDALARVLLSAPACDAALSQRWLQRPHCEIVVTVNQGDRTLRLADWLHNGQLLGRAPDVPTAPGVAYLDCSAVRGVGSSHDYLLRLVDVGAMDALNERLIRGESIDFHRLSVPGIKARIGSEVFEVPRWT